MQTDGRALVRPGAGFSGGLGADRQTDPRPVAALRRAAEVAASLWAGWETTRWAPRGVQVGPRPLAREGDQGNSGLDV